MPPPLGGTGKRTCQLTGGLRPSVAVSSTGESYTRIFHEKWKKEGWFVPVERQETLLHTG